MTEAFAGIGSNIRPLEHVPRALAQLQARFENLRVSNVYRCPAVGFNGASFINLVVGLDTDVGAHALQNVLREIETDCGRDRREKNASRTMDLDLLLYGDAVIEGADLCLPRADVLEYAFVLKPLSELAPDLRHPVDGRTYAELWAAFDASEQPLTQIALDEG